MDEMRRLLVPALAVAALAIAPIQAHAGTPGIEASAAQATPTQPAPAPQSTPLWATVNICDSPTYPNMMGVRASMPGNGTSERMYVRFKAEFYSRLLQAWKPAGGNATSPWLYVGSARYRSRQAGYTFTFKQPSPGSTYFMRGVAEYQWRAKKKTRKRSRRRARRSARARYHVRQTRTRVTKAGVVGVAGGDPAGQSLASCTIS